MITCLQFWRADLITLFTDWDSEHRVPRQDSLFLHGHFTVNGKKVNIPSYLVKVGDVITIKENSRNSSKIKDVLDITASRTVPQWLDLDKNTLTAKVVGEAARDDIDLPIEEHLIVELYSK